jgi:capsular polysaccharide biosynthesis protein
MLARDVDSAQKIYDMALLRVNQMSMEGRLDQSSVAILSAAAVPPFPASPKLGLNIALALVLGVLLGVGLALLRELRDRRARSAFDLNDLGLPVLCELARLDARPRRWMPLARLPRLPLQLSRSESP